MNFVAILLILITNLAYSICGANQDFTTKFIDVRKNVDKVSVANEKISKLRLIFLNSLKQNEIQQPIDSCWSSSQAIKITAKSCPCNQINCNTLSDARRRIISSSCNTVCCGNRKRPSIRSLSEAQIREIGKYSLKANCKQFNSSNLFVFARIYDKSSPGKSICSAVLVHQKFLITTAICVLNKKSSELIVKIGSDQIEEVKDVTLHPNFFKSIETLQDNIALLMLEREIYETDLHLPCITKSHVNDKLCQVYSWNSAKNFENSMKVDNVEVLSKGECYTSHLVSGKNHEKYVNKGNNNICVGNEGHFELDINLSGSALTCRSTIPEQPTVLRGILTWSTKLNFFPHIFTDISQFTNWIEQTINEKYLNSI